MDFDILQRLFLQLTFVKFICKFYDINYIYISSQMVLVVKNPPGMQEMQTDTGLIPELGRFPGGGHGNSLWYSCLENPHGQSSLVGYSP